jgi:5-methylcytosine-specific restriction protein A
MILKRIKDAIQGKAPLKTKRSSKWPAVRKNHLAKHPCCAVCGGTEKVEVHHIIPFHQDPSLELEPTNLISLCESKSFGIVCHLLIGHLGNYRKSNPFVTEDAKIWNEKLQN